MLVQVRTAARAAVTRPDTDGEPHRDDGTRTLERGHAQPRLGAGDDRHGPAGSRRATVFHRGNVCNMAVPVQVSAWWGPGGAGRGGRAGVNSGVHAPK